MTEVGWDDIPGLLVARVPGFAPIYEQGKEFYGDAFLNYVVLSEFNPYVAELIKGYERGEVPVETLREPFAVMEELAQHPDISVQELVMMGFLEGLGNDRELAPRVVPWLGPHSRKLWDEIEAFWEGDWRKQRQGEIARVHQLATSRRSRRRLEAVELLELLPRADAVALAYQLLADGHGGVQKAAAEMLRTKLGPQGRDALLRALHDEHEWRRLFAARAFAKEQDVRAIPVLERSLRGCDLDQYGPAIQGLACFGETTRELLERELIDEDNPCLLREIAAGSLSLLGNPASLPAMAAAEKSSDKQVVRAAHAARARLEKSDAAS